MLSLTALAILFGVLVVLGFRSGSGAGGGAVLIALVAFLVLGAASGLFPRIDFAAGVDGDETQFSLGTGDDVTETRNGVAVGSCLWDTERVVDGMPARPGAVFELTNTDDAPKKVRVELMLGNARSPVSDGVPIFEEVMDWAPAPAKDAHWLIPPGTQGPLAAPGDIAQPVSPVTLLAPDTELDEAISWCAVRLADVADA